MSALPEGFGDGARPRGGGPGPIAVAFCPFPPLLLPAVAGAAVADTAALRGACAEAVDAMLAVRPEVVVIVGPERPRAHDGLRYGPGDAGDLRGFGVDLQVPLAGRARPGGRRLPLSHTVGAWLLDAAGHAGARLGVPADGTAAALAELPGPVGLLAMGDGSARRTPKAPGYLDPAAEPFNAAVAAALAAGDAAALAGLDAAEGERLLAAGVSTWRAIGVALAGREVQAELLYDDAPFGVGYLVASWLVP